MLDPLEPVIRKLMADWPDISAPWVSALLRDDYNYSGSVDLVRKRMAVLRPPGGEGPAQRTGCLCRLARADRPAQTARVAAGRLRRGRPALVAGPADERGSIIVTSNRGFEAWGEILGDAMVAAALIDRLIHHAHMVALKGKSYRLKERGAGVAPAVQAPGLRPSA